MCTKRFASLMSVALIASCLAQTAYGLGGSLTSPGIAVPRNGPNGGENPVAAKIHETLMNHRTQFVNGWFVNSHSSMNFAGDTEELNSLLTDLSEIEGSKISIKFSNEKGVAQAKFAEAGAQNLACQWSISHDGSAQPEAVTMTIYLGDGLIQIDQLRLPTIRGVEQGPVAIEFTQEPKATE